ncbi:hypothetical protein Aple_065350 [Acrocarpospora pleiomorpha]|uniref:FtsH ternary system domain-containing protein n=1 Tax=Acrocarpospora pleiomorpha TaxID=90975 RepID=A0A5M3XS70_9ACTN|nr:hypothetical protein [Acrocarpospora pleiomorpha]GES23636.1 hypothetical protein Aple_065350 [Acrocarpospora pleiomorpha]
MGAVETAQRVLDWVARPAGNVPNGTLWKAARLADPPPDVVRRLAEITWRSNAVRGMGNPPFGEAARVGLGGVLLAAVIGGRDHPEPAMMIANSLVRTRSRLPDATARHAVVLPALRGVPSWQGVEGLPDLLLRASPLTAVLHHPPGDPDSSEYRAVQERVAELVTRPHGRAVVVGTLAECDSDVRVLGWRAYLLNQWLRHGELDLVRDVYATAWLRHGKAWARQIGQALRWEGKPTPVMKATGAYWAAAERVDLGRTRPVARGYDSALRLVHRYRTWRGR